MTLMTMRGRMRSKQKGATVLEYIVLAAVLVLGLVTAINSFKGQVASGIAEEGKTLHEITNKGNAAAAEKYGD